MAILTSMPLEVITGGLGALNLVGLAADVLGIHGAIGGVYTGRQLNRMEQQLERLHARVERLNPYILHADVQEVINTEGRSQRIARLSDVESLLSPVQRSLGEDLLSTALITTPAKLRAAFQRDPWDVLIGTRSLNLARRPQVDGEYLPIIFTQESTIYLGWQTIGMMRTTLGTEYSPIEGRAEVADPVSRGAPEMRQSQRSQNTTPSLSKSVAPKNKGNSNRGMIVVATIITVPILLFATYERLRPQAATDDEIFVATDNQTLAASDYQTPAEVKMHHIPAGRFFMGCNENVDKECRDDEKPGRTVSVKAFFIDRTEVTVSAYAECVRAGECSDYHLTGIEWKDVPGWNDKLFTKSEYCNWGKRGREKHPINCVDWNQASKFCAWKGKRLPTEAEWEKAARGIDGKKYPWGNQQVTCDYAILNDGGYGCGQNSTWPVGSKPAGKSPYGALDMVGNVYEWTDSWWDESERKYRVIRGGSWFGRPARARASYRDGDPPGSRLDGVGFRCLSDHSGS